MQQHPVPAEYHELFAIGKTDRRGNIIDFKIPPIIIDSPVSMDEFRRKIFKEHVPAEDLPLVYHQPKRFLVLRPTALTHKVYVKDELTKSGLLIDDEFELDNFMKLADALYLLDPKTSFHWKWRVIMGSLHESGLQDQNRAVVFILKDQEDNSNLMDIKKRIRTDMGETPIVVRHNGVPEIALGIHHLHSPDLERLAVEYNALVHAKNKTSIFV